MSNPLLIFFLRPTRVKVNDLRQEALFLGLQSFLDAPVNRKGLDVVVLA